MTRPGIEPRSPGPLANTLTAGPMSRFDENVKVLNKCSTQVYEILIIKNAKLEMICGPEVGFDPSLECLTCLTTLKSCDTTKQSVCGWQYIRFPLHRQVEHWGKNITVTTDVIQSSLTELSTQASDSAKCKQTTFDTYVLIPELGLTYSLAGFDPGLECLTYVATLKSCDITRQSIYISRK